MHADFGAFAERNRKLAAAVGAAHTAAKGKNTRVPEAYMHVNKVINDALALLPKPTPEQLARWDALPDLRSRVGAVVVALTEVPQNLHIACFKWILVKSIDDADAELGAEPRVILDAVHDDVIRVEQSLCTSSV